MIQYIERALKDLKRLEDETTGVSAGSASLAIGWFLTQSLSGVILNLETAIQIAEMKNDRGGNHDH